MSNEKSLSLPTTVLYMAWRFIDLVLCCRSVFAYKFARQYIIFRMAKPIETKCTFQPLSPLEP